MAENRIDSQEQPAIENSQHSDQSVENLDSSGVSANILISSNENILSPMSGNEINPNEYNANNPFPCNYYILPQFICLQSPASYSYVQVSQTQSTNFPSPSSNFQTAGQTIVTENNFQYPQNPLIYKPFQTLGLPIEPFLNNPSASSTNFWNLSKMPADILSQYLTPQGNPNFLYQGSPSCFMVNSSANTSIQQQLLNNGGNSQPPPYSLIAYPNIPNSLIDPLEVNNFYTVFNTLAESIKQLSLQSDTPFSKKESLSTSANPSCDRLTPFQLSGGERFSICFASLLLIPVTNCLHSNTKPMSDILVVLNKVQKCTFHNIGITAKVVCFVDKFIF